MPKANHLNIWIQSNYNTLRTIGVGHSGEDGPCSIWDVKTFNQDTNSSLYISLISAIKKDVNVVVGLPEWESWEISETHDGMLLYRSGYEVAIEPDVPLLWSMRINDIMKVVKQPVRIVRKVLVTVELDPEGYASGMGVDEEDVINNPDAHIRSLLDREFFDSYNRSADTGMAFGPYELFEIKEDTDD